MKKNTERGLTPLPGDQGARSARKPSIGVNSTQQNSNGYYNAGQGYSEPITETDYFQTFEGEEDPLTGMAAD